MPECLILAIDSNMHSFLPCPSPKEPDIPARLLPVFLIETSLCKRIALPGVSRGGAALLPAGSPFMGMKRNAHSLRQVGTYWIWGSGEDNKKRKEIIWLLLLRNVYWMKSPLVCFHSWNCFLSAKLGMKCGTDLDSAKSSSCLLKKC